MIYTFDTKRAQLRDGFYQTGSGPRCVLIVGSCRTMAFLNYLAAWNEVSGNELTIRYINPFDWHWNAVDELVDLESAIDAMETHSGVLGVIGDTDIFIHEHYGNYGMFNTSRDAAKNIYQFGMNANTDISIPNFHDHFILYNDFAAFGEVPEDWKERGLAAVDKFCNLCAKTSFPEMAEYFRSNWQNMRLFWTPNHTSGAFTLYLFRRMNDVFLNLPLSNDFWQRIGGDDMFRDPHTPVHQKDIETYKLTWNH